MAWSRRAAAGRRKAARLRRVRSCIRFSLLSGSVELSLALKPRSGSTRAPNLRSYSLFSLTGWASSSTTCCHTSASRRSFISADSHRHVRLQSGRHRFQCDDNRHSPEADFCPMPFWIFCRNRPSDNGRKHSGPEAGKQNHDGANESLCDKGSIATTNTCRQ